MIENILPSDTLETGFRTKANNAFDEIINDDPFIEGGLIKFPKHGGGYWTLDLGTDYFNKDEVIGQIQPLDLYATESVVGRVQRASYDEGVTGVNTTKYTSPALVKEIIRNTNNLIDNYTIGVHNFEFGEARLMTSDNAEVGIGAYNASGIRTSYLNTTNGGWKFLSEQNAFTANLDFSNLTSNINIDLKNLATTASSGSWNLDGNTVTAEKSFGTLDDFNVPIIQNGNTVAVFNAKGASFPSIQEGELFEGARDFVFAGIDLAAPTKQLIKVTNSQATEYLSNYLWKVGGNALSSSQVMGSVSGSDFDIPVHRNGVEVGKWRTGGLTVPTLISSNLTANYVPKHTASGLANSLIFDNGNIGIGTTSPLSKLHLQGLGTYNSNTRGQFTIADSTTTTKSLTMGVDGGSNFAFINSVNIGLGLIPLSINPQGGNVGIGTTSPSDKLTLEGGNQGIKSGGYLKLYHSANNNWSAIYSPASGVFAVNTGGVTNALYLDTYGSLGIGTTTPTQKLDVNGNVKATGLMIPTSAAVGYAWKCTDATTGAGTWQSVSIGERWKGVWAANSGTAPSASPGEGDYYTVITAGTYLGVTYAVNDYSYYTGSAWVYRPNGYILTPATTGGIGGVVIGTTMEVNGFGVINQKSGVVTVGNYTKVTVDTYGRVITGTTLSASDIPSLDASKITSGTFADARIASAATWNAKQNALDGTGYVKMTGTTVSYDNRDFVDIPNAQTVTGSKTFNAATIFAASTSGASLSILGETAAHNGKDAKRLMFGSNWVMGSYKAALFYASDYMFRQGNVKIGGVTTPSATVAWATESLDVDGNIKYSGTLKPSGTAPTTGQFLKATSATANAWATITYSDISDLDSFTGFDDRYVDLTTNQLSINGNKTFNGVIRSSAISLTQYGTPTDGWEIQNVLSGGQRYLSFYNEYEDNEVAALYSTGEAIYGKVLVGGGTLTDVTESLVVNGNIKYSGLLKIGASSGTNGQFLKRTSTANEWATITASDVLPTATTGQVLAFDGTNYNAMHLEIAPSFLKANHLAIGNRFNMLSHRTNVTLEDELYFKITQKGTTKSVCFGFDTTSSNGVFDVSDGSIYLNSDNLFVSSLKGGSGISNLGVDNLTGKLVKVSGSTGGTGSQDLNSVLAVGSTAIDKPITLNSTVTGIFGSALSFTDKGNFRGRIFNDNQYVNRFIIESEYKMQLYSHTEGIELIGNSLKVSHFAGSGTKMVVTDNSGFLSLATIPSGGSGSTISIPDHRIAFGASDNSLTSSALLNYYSSTNAIVMNNLSGGDANMYIHNPSANLFEIRTNGTTNGFSIISGTIDLTSDAISLGVLGTGASLVSIGVDTTEINLNESLYNFSNSLSNGEYMLFKKVSGKMVAQKVIVDGSNFIKLA